MSMVRKCDAVHAYYDRDKIIVGGIGISAFADDETVFIVRGEPRDYHLPQKGERFDFCDVDCLRKWLAGCGTLKAARDAE